MSDQSKRTLTSADIQAIADVFDERFQINTIKLTQAFATKEDLKQMEERIRSDFSHLPTKDEFYKSQDKLMTRLKKIDENTDIQAGQIEDHSERLEKIESKLSISLLAISYLLVSQVFLRSASIISINYKSSAILQSNRLAKRLSKQSVHSRSCDGWKCASIQKLLNT